MLNFKEVVKKIEEYNRIIIHRHSRPDLDALGSQLGLREVIKANYPNKEVYVVGDSSKRYGFIGEMDNISDDLYTDSLVIICDVGISRMISDERYKLAKERMVIDHHENGSDVEDVNLCIIPSMSACAELITHLVIEEGLKITPYGATCLYGGMVTDNGRFLYDTTYARTFRAAAFLLDNGADIQYIYKNITRESLKMRKLKNFFASRITFTDEGVAYLFNDKDVFLQMPELDFFEVSRGMVGLMGGIEEIGIYANFTYDISTDKVIGEFRSQEIPIVDIAKKYGGGGHALACGATLNDFAEAKLVIADFIKRYKGEKVDGC